MRGLYRLLLYGCQRQKRNCRMAWSVLAPPSDVTARLRSGLAGQPSHILAKAEPVDRLVADELPLLAMSCCSHHQLLPNWACQAAQGRRAIVAHTPASAKLHTTLF